MRKTMHCPSCGGAIYHDQQVSPQQNRIDRLIASFMADPSRRDIARQLVSEGSNVVIPLLRQLGNRTGDWYLATMEVIAEIGADATDHLVALLLMDPNAVVRANAATCFEGLDVPEKAIFLMATLVNPAEEPHVQIAVANTLPRMGNPYLHDPLRSIANYSMYTREVQAAIQRACDECSAPAREKLSRLWLAQGLASAWEEVDADRVEYLVVGLVQRRDIDGLTALVGHPVGWISARAIEALCKLRDARAIPGLILVLQCQPGWASVVAKALINSKDPRSVEPLVELIKLEPFVAFKHEYAYRFAAIGKLAVEPVVHELFTLNYWLKAVHDYRINMVEARARMAWNDPRRQILVNEEERTRAIASFIADTIAAFHQSTLKHIEGSSAEQARLEINRLCESLWGDSETSCT